MNVHYGDILVKYGEILDITKDELTYLVDDGQVYDDPEMAYKACSKS